MELYKIEITETLQRQIEVEAASREEAERIVKEKYESEEIVLSSEDHVDTEICAVCKKKYRNYEER